MGEIGQGLTLSLMGILITFAALGALILVMVILREAFSPRRPVEAKPIAADEDGEESRRRAAAVAVAVARLQAGQQRGDPTLGRLLETPAGAWWQVNALRNQND